jgi:hypothetical protein
MGDDPGADLLAAAEATLPPESMALLRALHEFARARLAGVRLRQRTVGPLLDAGARAEAESDLHALLRECWEVLDGLAREVKLCMAHLFPDAGLYAPAMMTRQCTFYVVRKKLHEGTETANHPVTRLLYDSTRAAATKEYERLSFLYNVSLFLPLALTEDGALPGSADLTDTARAVVKPAQIDRCGAKEGLEEITNWLESLVGECYQRLAAGLAATR